MPDEQGGSFLDLNLDDAQEPKVLPEGEYKIRVSGAEKSTDKNNNPYILLRLEVPDEPYSKTFTHFLGFPTDDMTPKDQNARKWRMKEAFEAFGFDYQSRPLEDLRGSETWATLGETDEDPTYGKSNRVIQWHGKR